MPQALNLTSKSQTSNELKAQQNYSFVIVHLATCFYDWLWMDLCRDLDLTPALSTDGSQDSSLLSIITRKARLLFLAIIIHGDSFWQTLTIAPLSSNLFLKKMAIALVSRRSWVVVLSSSLTFFHEFWVNCQLEFMFPKKSDWILNSMMISYTKKSHWINFKLEANTFRNNFLFNIWFRLKNTKRLARC